MLDAECVIAQLFNEEQHLPLNHAHCEWNMQCAFVVSKIPTQSTQATITEEMKTLLRKFWKQPCVEDDTQFFTKDLSLCYAYKHVWLSEIHDGYEMYHIAYVSYPLPQRRPQTSCLLHLINRASLKPLVINRETQRKQEVTFFPSPEYVMSDG